MQFTALLFTLLASGVALAAPSTRGSKTRCDVSSVTIPTPASQPSGTPLATPIAGGPKFIGIGVGVQNYTCGSTGTYTYVAFAIVRESRLTTAQQRRRARRDLRHLVLLPRRL